MTAKKRGLGKGLDALFIDNSTEHEGEIQTLPINDIEPNKDQPRKEFDQEALAQLADSIQNYGILQPLLVRPLQDGTYQIVAGERRWRASRMAGITEVPVIIRDMTEEDVVKVALVENLQREDLNPLEEALGYQKLIDEYELTQEEVAKAVGKARSGVANSLRLLNLPDEVKEMLKNNTLSQGHAKVLLGVDDTQKLILLAEETVQKQLSVRQLEALVKAAEAKEEEAAGKEPEKLPSYLKEAELSLTEHLGTKVKFSGSEESGTMQLSYYSKEELQAIIKLLSNDY